MKLDGDEITAKLEPIVGDKAESLSNLIQEKLILRNRMKGLETLRDKLNEKGRYNPRRVESAKEELARYKQKNLERVMNPKEHETFLSSLAAQTVGTELSRDQAKTVFDKSKNIQQLKIDAKDAFFGATVKLVKAQHDLTNYINRLNEKPAWKSMLDSAASLYKNLFIGIKTGVKTATLGTLNGAIEVLNRRATGGVRIGDVDTSLKMNGIKENILFYVKTGENTFLKTSFDDNSVFGTSKKGVFENFGKEDNIAPGKLRPIAKGMNAVSQGVRYVAIDLLHKAPMLANMSLSFVDASDITSSQLARLPLAKNLNMDANAIFKDSMKVEPETILGQIARNRSQQEAFRILNINNTVLADAAVGLQRSFNNALPNAHIGDYLLPMAKVPSNVLYNGIENAGLGIGTGLVNVIKGTKELNGLAETERADTADGVKAVMQIRDGYRTLTRTIGTIAAAVLITKSLTGTKKDFRTDNYGNAYVKMGNFWVSTQIFGQGSTAVTGILMGKGGHDGFLNDYSKAGFEDLQKAPVTGDILSTVKKGTANGLPGFASGILGSFAKPILAADIEKSIKENTLNPVLVGTLIRTEAQVKQEDTATKQKSAVSKKAHILQKK
jgi:hypothetical protein